MVSPIIDLGEAERWPATEQTRLAVIVPALPNLVEGETITLNIQQSDTTTPADFANIPGATVTLTGDVGNGAAAFETRFALPPAVKRYLRLEVTASGSAGDNTASQATLALAF